MAASPRPSPSQLSAEAPAFLPTNDDGFAATGGGQEGLFDDGFVPLSEQSMQTRSADDLFSDSFTPITEPIVEQAVATPENGNGGWGGFHRGRGRGRGRYQNQAPPQFRPPVPTQSASNDESVEAFTHPPKGPRNATNNAPISVRGDRRATGGLQKPKLTEEELTAKMEAMKLKSSERTAAHAKAEADAAAFAQRENVAEQKRKVERKDRQQMMGEREKNRQRKMQAMGGREWDAEKNEDDLNQRGGRKGFLGDGEDYSDGREYIYREDRGRGRGRGRDGGRGWRGGTNGQMRQGAPPKQDDFPALPPATEKQAAATAGPLDAVADVKSWADQAEASAPT